jgi:hypothetical protein
VVLLVYVDLLPACRTVVARSLMGASYCDGDVDLDEHIYSIPNGTANNYIYTIMNQ